MWNKTATKKTVDENNNNKESGGNDDDDDDGDGEKVSDEIPMPKKREKAE